MKSVVIIAEAGVNHNGDINLAKELIKQAKNIKADYVKFQSFVTEEIYLPKPQKLSINYKLLYLLNLNFRC